MRIMIMKECYLEMETTVYANVYYNFNIVMKRHNQLGKYTEQENHSIIRKTIYFLRMVENINDNNFTKF